MAAVTLNPAAPPTISLTLVDGTIAQVSTFGDRMDWSASPGNAEANAKFPDPCPVCGHKLKGAHCEPYAPTPTTLVARCSVQVPVLIANPDGSVTKTYVRCQGGACVIPR